MNHSNPTRSLFRSSYLVCALLGLAVSGLSGCGSQKAQAAPSGPPPVAVTTAQLQRRSLDDSEFLDGKVVPYLQANIATQTSGTVLKVYADEGDHVHEGDILAKIDDAPLQAQLAQQKGSSQQAAAKLSQAQIQQPITAQTAQSGLIQAQESLNQAQKQLLADEAAVRENKVSYDANEKLYSQGYVASTTRETSRANFVASQQTLAIDQAHVAQAKSAVDSARRSLLTINVQKQVVAEGSGAVQQASGTTQLLETQIGQTVLRAPFDGVVTQRMLDPGAYASPNQPLFSMAKIDPVYITFNVKDSDIAYVHKGTVTTFTTSSVPGKTFRGRVNVVNVVPSTGTLLYPARMVVENPGEALKGGMLVNVRIVKSSVGNALAAPVSSVVEAFDGSSVYAVMGEGKQAVAKKIPVKTGIKTQDFVQIMSPALHDNMTLITNKSDLLQDGGPVAVAKQP